MNDGDREIRVERLPTGIVGLDSILHGGFIKDGIYIIQGEPGSGKTILGNQLCFNRVANGGKAAFVTLLAESHARMLLNLGGFRFFDAGVIPGSLYYVSALAALEAEGLKGLLDVVRREVRAHGADVLVVDGLVAAQESAESGIDLKKFIHELQSQNSLLGCTTFLLSSGSRAVRPERTMVDGIVEMSDALFSGRRERRFELTKFRGSGYLRGQHAYEITDDGICIYPRLEAALVRPRLSDDCLTQRISTGVDGLDQMLGGEGLPAGTASLLLGPPGAGKSSFGLHFLSRCNERERGVYLSFYETQARAAEKATRLGLRLPALLESGVVRHLWKPTTENILDSLGHELLAAVADERVRRVFIDGMEGFRHAAADSQRMLPFVTALVNELRSRGITTLYTGETRTTLGPEIEAPPPGISAVLENWIAIRFTEIGSKLRRLISVLKVRDSGFDALVREFTITPRGIQIGAPLAVPESVNAGMALTPDRTLEPAPDPSRALASKPSAAKPTRRKAP
jgi:circadian clock protein KaiC